MKRTLFFRFVVYLVLVHAVLAVAIAYALPNTVLWLLVVEVLCLLSLWVAVRFFRNFYRPLALLVTGAEFLRESDFSTQLLPTGQKEMDELVAVYNIMMDNLRSERLQQQEQQHLLRSIIKASPSGIIIFDFDGNIALCNPAVRRLLGIPPHSDILGKKAVELPDPVGAVLALLKSGESTVVTLAAQRKLRCQRLEFFDRGFARSFIVVEELTEELRHIERAAYEKVIRIFAHEVNNSVGASNSLLHSCLHYSKQLCQEDRSDFATALGVAITRGSHLCDFVQRYAEVVKLPPPQLQACDIISLLEHVALLFHAECQKKCILWKWNIVPLQPLLMDKQQIEQVFINLCKNAIEAIGEHGVLVVRTGYEHGKPVVVIEDTGCGISPEVQKELLTPFFSTKEYGQGIGLTMAREILAQHGFSLSLQSTISTTTQCKVQLG